MAAFRSAPRGDRRLGWRAWAAGLVVAWCAPAAAGLAGFGLGVAAGRLGATDAALGTLGASGWLLLFSPLASWIWLGLTAPLCWLWLRLGMAGWVNIGATGAAMGSLGAGAVAGLPAEAGMILGAAQALILRHVWTWIAPGALAVPAATAGRS
jgi:hypothetical protein